MKKPSDFWQQYKDPRWQRRRLERMEAADFACDNCGEKEKTLNVHHGHYVKGRKPWEYPDEELHVMCEPCHEEVHANLSYLRLLLAMHPDHIGAATGFVIGLISKDGEEAISWPNDRASWELVDGLVRSWPRRAPGDPADKVIKALSLKDGVYSISQEKLTEITGD